MTAVSKPSRAITVRAVLIGLVGTLIISLGTPYGVYVVHGSYMALDFSTPGAVFLFFVLVALVNGLWKRLSRRTALQPGELITAYIMMILASAIPTMGLTAQILPIIATPYYYATPENRWERLLQPLLNRHLTPRDAEAIKHFFEGAPGRPVPWEVWLPPLLVWLPLILALYFVMIGLMVMLRRQWINRERLAYPLTQLPLELVNERDPLLKKPALWLGFAVPFFLGSLIALHNYFPAVPGPKLNTSLSTFRDTLLLHIRLSFPMLGFFYLINLDTAFSIWFFNRFFFLLRGFLNILGVELKENLGGYGTPFVPYKYLGMGAMMTLVVGGFWLARPHLRDVVRKAWGQAPEVDDRDEILSYPVAFWGTVGGLLVMSLWLHWSGLPYWATWLYLFFAFLLFVGLTRVVVESGLAEAVAAAIAPSFIVAGFGSLTFGRRGLMALGLTWVYSADIRTFVMASSAHSLRLAEAVGANRRPLFGALVLAILASLGASIWMTLTLAYRYGGATLNSWFFITGPQWPYQWVETKLLNPSDPSTVGWFLTGLGAGVMALLTVMRQRFIWWPFHPIGFCIGSVWIMDQLWLTCFVAWAVKLLILRYGGLRLYRLFRPFFLGLILGQFTCNGLWLVVDYFTGQTNNRIFWI
ncbi:MAG TPA: hypothetical protein EYP85_15630 [Armatimonadetes bacterium]|nr:hypothetical protein [Armatimonadota bacterium]